MRTSFRITALLALLVAPCTALAGAGDLDPTFGGDGQVTTSFTRGASIQRVFVRPDQKIVAVGSTTVGSGADVGHALARYLPNGDLDPSFGTGGTVVQTFDTLFGIPRPFVIDADLQPDGKIVVLADGGVFNHSMAVRYDASGAYDPTLGSAGAAFIEQGNWFGGAIVVRPDGKIVVVRTRRPTPSDDGIGVTRFLPDGEPDATFGSGGEGFIDTGDAFQVSDAALQTDGKILVAGISRQGSNEAPLLVRFTENGAPDPGFGTGGVVILPTSIFGDPECDVRIEALALRPDGRILTAGGFNCFPFDVLDGTTLVQYLEDGSLDPAFGDGGIVLPSVTELGSAADLVIDADGRALVDRGELGAVRRDADGFLDTTFGVGGEALDDAPVPSFTNTMALQADGKVILAGATRVDDDDDRAFSLARRETACPTLPDADGDGVGDACDRCTGGGTLDRAKVQLSNQTTPIGDDSMGVKGKFLVGDPAAIDPIANGLRVSLYDALDRGVLEVVLPGGAFDPDTNAGWSAKVKGARTTFKYLNKGNRIPRIDGVSNVKVTVGTDGLVDFKLKARNGELPVDPARPLADVAVILDPPRATTGLCGELEFDGVAGGCFFSASGRKVLCR